MAAAESPLQGEPERELVAERVYPAPADSYVRELRQLRILLDELSERRRQLCRTLADDCDLSTRDIAREAGISHTQVARLIKGES